MSHLTATNLLRHLIDALLVSIVLVVLFGLVLSRLAPLAGRQSLIIGGRSMEPAIPLGAAVVVEPVAATALVPGDVISLRLSGGTVVTHRLSRVVARDDGLWFETKGDANEGPDPALVPATELLGRVAWTFPFAGYLLRLLALPSGLLMFAGLGGALFVAGRLLDEEAANAAEEAAREASPAARPVGRAGGRSGTARTAPRRAGGARARACARDVVPARTGLPAGSPSLVRPGAVT